MSSYQGSTSVRAGAKDVFGFVSNPENIPQFVPAICNVDVRQSEVIYIEGECPHGRYRGVGGLHVEAEDMRMRWDSRANLKYRGWLSVVEKEDASLVTIHLEFDPGLDYPVNREFAHLLKDHPATIQEAIDKSLEKIKAICEEAALTAAVSVI